MFIQTCSYYTLMVWFPELFNRFEEFEETYPNMTASVCDVSSVNLKPDGTDIFCGEPVNDSVYIHTLIVGLACIPTSLWLPLCVHRLGAKFFLSESKIEQSDIFSVKHNKNYYCFSIQFSGGRCSYGWTIFCTVG